MHLYHILTSILKLTAIDSPHLDAAVPGTLGRAALARPRAAAVAAASGRGGGGGGPAAAVSVPATD